MTAIHLSYVPLRPEVHVRGRSGTAVALEDRNLRGLALACIRMKRTEEGFEDPAVIWRKEGIDLLGRRNGFDLLVQIAADNSSELGKEDMHRYRAGRPVHVRPRQVTRHLEGQSLETPVFSVWIERHAFEAPWSVEGGTAGFPW